MTDGVLISAAWAKRLVAGLATVGAVALTVEGTVGQPQPTPDLRGAIPQNLKPDEYVVGVPWTGEPGTAVTVAELEAATAREPKAAGPIERRRDQSGAGERLGRISSPDSPLVARWPFGAPSPVARERVGPSLAFTASTAINGPSYGAGETTAVPPDSNGAVGPNHVMITSNGRFKIFTKSGTLLASFSDTSLWTGQTAAGVSDPHIRYDRTSGRWFITEIDVANTSNKILVAVSAGSDITSASNFTVYSFAHDSPGGGGIDAGHFADYDTLGVDANALYVGVNEFASGSPGSAFQNTSGYVIRKSSVTSGGPIVVTAFRGLALNGGVGAYAPQGVQNDDPSANEGYFVGVDNIAFGKLDLYRVTTPGATPALSGVMQITVPNTNFPIGQVASGSVNPLDALDDRLFAAEVRTNRFTGVQTLWTAHNVSVSNTGVSPVYPTLGDRNGSRWYEIGNLTTTPTLVQAGTLFDGSPTLSNTSGFWIPSIVMNGQGHAVLASSEARPSVYASAAYASRFSSDPAGTLPWIGLLADGGGAYNLGPGNPQRWGDYSQTVVDPNDDMTVWTFQEFASAANVWTVRAQKLQAPGVASIVSASPSTVPKTNSTVITITGSALAGGFFDPGPGFPNRINVVFSNGITVNSVAVVDPTHVHVDINTASATPGSVTVTVSNPDLSTTQKSGLFTVAAIAGDFDGDAKAEMTIYKHNGDWAILRSSTNYVASTVVSWGGDGYTPVPGDYDGDSRIDPAVYNTATGQWLAKQSSTNYTTVFAQSWGGTGYQPVPGDYDGDGKTDLGLYVQSTGQWLILKSSTGYTTSLGVSWGGGGFTAVPGRDFDGDGKSDIAVYRESTGYWYVLKSSTSFFTVIIVGWGGHGYTLVPGDYDGDGKADLGLYERSTGWWYILNSIGGYTASTSVSWGGADYDPVPGDYDGDHRIDIAVIQRSSGNWYVLESSTSYTASFAVTGWGAAADTFVSDAIRVGGSDVTRATDYDADAKADITVYSSEGSWLTLTSSTGYTGSLIRSWGGAGYTAAPGDFDGDGKVDLSLYQNSTGNWLVLLSEFGYTTSLGKSAGGDLYVPVVGDYDGDGKSDFAVYNRTTGNWYVLQSSTGFATPISINWGGTGYAPAPGDYDGDGRTDLGLYQSSTGNWYVLLSSTNYTTTLSKNAGGPGYTAAAGDYDGDGKADFIVYNGTTGLWFGLKSGANYTTTLSVSWGGPGYETVQGDYDGDGKVDLALYQTSTGLWSILLSGSGYTTTLGKSWGGAGYTPVPMYP